MRIHIKPIIIAVLLGAATTVLVAEFCALVLQSLPSHQVGKGFSIGGGCAWSIVKYERTGACEYRGYPASLDFARLTASRSDLQSNAAVTCAHRPFTECPPQRAGSIQGIVKESGWPWRALVGGGIAEQSGPALPWHVIETRGAYARAFGSIHMDADGLFLVLPMQVLWKGFMLDTLLFAACWFMLILAARTMRFRRHWQANRSLRTGLILCPVLGCLTTISVAAFLAIATDERSILTGAISYNGPHYRIWWLTRHESDFAQRVYSSWVEPGDELSAIGGTAERTLPAWANYVRPRDGSDMSTTQIIAEARGWPMLALWGGFETRRSQERVALVDHLARSKHAIVLPRFARDGRFREDWTRIVPLMPIWPGFVVNSLVFTSIWMTLLLLIAGPGMIRRRSRRRSGRCLACGYDLRSARGDFCPECGSPRFEALQT